MKSVLDPLVPHVFNSVWPVLDPLPRLLLQVHLIPCSIFQLSLHLGLSTADVALLAKALQVVNGDNGCMLVVFGFEVAKAGATVVGAVVETTFLGGAGT